MPEDSGEMTRATCDHRDLGRTLQPVIDGLQRLDEYQRVQLLAERGVVWEPHDISIA